MTTHELANLFDHLRAGLASGLKAPTIQAFAEASEAFRELPDQSLKTLVKSIKDKPTPSRSGKKGSSPIDMAQLIERIRGVRAGVENPDSVSSDIDRLNNNQLKEVLKGFGRKPTTKVDDNRSRVRQLLAESSDRTDTPTANNNDQLIDSEMVARGVQTYLRLRDDKTLSISDVRAQFEPILSLPKPVVEDITRQLGYTPTGSRDEMARRLLTNLENLKLSQLKGDWIQSGK